MVITIIPLDGYSLATNTRKMSESLSRKIFIEDEQLTITE